jgi:hypothetical protein
VAQADLVQAGLLRNPILDASVAFHLGPVRPDLQLGMVFGLLRALRPAPPAGGGRAVRGGEARGDGGRARFRSRGPDGVPGAPGRRADARAAPDRRGRPRRVVRGEPAAASRGQHHGPRPRPRSGGAGALAARPPGGRGGRAPESRAAQ